MLFIIVVMLGFCVIEMSLQGRPWIGCTCIGSSSEVEKECNRSCVGHGGCLYWQVDLFDCTCVEGGCSCAWYYECEDRSHGWMYTYDYGCPDC